LGFVPEILAADSLQFRRRKLRCVDGTIALCLTRTGLTKQRESEPSTAASNKQQATTSSHIEPVQRNSRRRALPRPPRSLPASRHSPDTIELHHRPLLPAPPGYLPLESLLCTPSIKLPLSPSRCQRQATATSAAAASHPNLSSLPGNSHLPSHSLRQRHFPPASPLSLLFLIFPLLLPYPRSVIPPSPIRRRLLVALTFRSFHSFVPA
jgi:hypothetical protein